MIYLSNNKVIKVINRKNNSEERLNQNKYYEKGIYNNLGDYTYLSKILKKSNYIYVKGKGIEYRVIPLSGKEKKLKLSFKANSKKFEIQIFDHKWRSLFKEKKNTERIQLIDVNKHINKNDKINYSFLRISIKDMSNSKWWLKIEFEGEEIEIG